MPAKSKAQFRLMKAAENNPAFAKKVGIKPSVAAEYVSSNEGKKSYSNLPENKARGGVSLAVGRGEKLPTDRGAGLTQKGRDKYNRETGSHLKAPQPKGGARKDSFCARMSGVVEHSKGDAPRAKASLRRWNCPGW
jgi:hypothetical protein